MFGDKDVSQLPEPTRHKEDSGQNAIEFATVWGKAKQSQHHGYEEVDWKII